MTVFTDYCKNCGHPKEHHDLNTHFDPKKARQRGKERDRACSDMSFDDHHCICMEYQSWF